MHCLTQIFHSGWTCKARVILSDPHTFPLQAAEGCRSKAWHHRSTRNEFLLSSNQWRKGTSRCIQINLLNVLWWIFPKVASKISSHWAWCILKYLVYGDLQLQHCCIRQEPRSVLLASFLEYFFTITIHGQVQLQEQYSSACFSSKDLSRMVYRCLGFKKRSLGSPNFVLFQSHHSPQPK